MLKCNTVFIVSAQPNMVKSVLMELYESLNLYEVQLWYILLCLMSSDGQIYNRFVHQ